MTIDIARCRAGMKELVIEGFPRQALIEEAIRLIQQAPADALMKHYLGIKNYASFGDQREDHQYGYGPKHGSIVFRIGRTDESRRVAQPITNDAVYLLEAYRDFQSIWEDEHANPRRALYLCDAIRRFDKLTAERNRIADAFEHFEVEAHV